MPAVFANFTILDALSAHFLGFPPQCHDVLRDLPLVALDELANQTGELFSELDRIVTAHQGLWSPEAERFLLEYAPRL